MSRNISDENLLMNIQLEEPTIELPKAKEERTVENATLNNEEAFLVGRNPVIEEDLTPEELNSLSNSTSINENKENTVDPDAHEIVSYHTSLLYQRYGLDAAEDYRNNSNPTNGPKV